LGLILIFLGIVIILLPFLSKENEENLHQNQIHHDQPGIQEEKTTVSGGAIIMLGPIPIIVGSDSKTTLYLILLALALMLLWLLILKGA
jgi:uncharacterized protein (TIGR00304 family)